MGHKRSECWKYWKDHQNQIRAMHKQEEEAIEQVECQTCWMVGQVDEVVPLPEASWSRPRKLAGPNLGRWPKSGDLVQLMAMDARMYVAIDFKVLDEEEDFDINEVRGSSCH